MLGWEQIWLISYYYRHFLQLLTFSFVAIQSHIWFETFSHFILIIWPFSFILDPTIFLLFWCSCPFPRWQDLFCKRISCVFLLQVLWFWFSYFKSFCCVFCVRWLWSYRGWCYWCLQMICFSSLFLNR
jgi:hypothetical protein